MGKIIIHNDSSINDVDAIARAKTIMENGRVSKNDTQYCYVSVFADGVTVCSSRTKSGTDVLRLTDK